MRLPYKPRAVLHKWGGTIIEITCISHQVRMPSGGLSRDTWAFEGTVRWDDGLIRTGKISPALLCSDTDAGRTEVVALTALMTKYLNKHGEWRTDVPSGWLAHR